MSYFDAITSQAFQKNQEGKTTFFPFGLFFKGFVIDSPEKEMQLKNTYQKVVRLNFFFSIILSLVINAVIKSVFGFAPWITISTIFILYAIGFYFYIRHITKGLARSNKGPSFVKACQTTAMKLNFFTLTSLLVISLSMFVLATLLLIKKITFWLSLLAMILLGLAAITYAYMIYYKLKK